MAAAKDKKPAADPPVDEAPAVEVAAEDAGPSEARVELVTTHNVASGIDASGRPLDHVGSPFDHVIEVHN